MVLHDSAAILVDLMTTAIRDPALAFPGLERALAIINLSRFYRLHRLHADLLFLSKNHTS
jgi:hypothetical protein